RRHATTARCRAPAPQPERTWARKAPAPLPRPFSFVSRRPMCLQPPLGAGPPTGDRVDLQSLPCRRDPTGTSAPKAICPHPPCHLRPAPLAICCAREAGASTSPSNCRRRDRVSGWFSGPARPHCARAISDRRLARPMPAALPFAGLPQALRGLRVLGLRARPPTFHIDEVPTIPADIGGTGQPNQRFCALFHRPRHRPQQGHRQAHQWAVVSVEAAGNQTWVKATANRAAALEPACKFTREQDVGELGLLVSGKTMVGPLGGKVVEGDS